MRIGIATDHGGFELERKTGGQASWSRAMKSLDFGANKLVPEDDYPDFVIPLGAGGG